jgi:hypothetical protein
VKLTLESTTRLVEIVVNGQSFPARVWQGVTANGVPCFAFITRLAVESGADTAEFEAELQESRPPSPEAMAFPLRMIL